MLVDAGHIWIRFGQSRRVHGELIEGEVYFWVRFSFLVVDFGFQFLVFNDDCRKQSTNQSIESSGRFSHIFSVFLLGFLIQFSFNQRANLINYSKEMLVYSTIHMDSYGENKKRMEDTFDQLSMIIATTNHSKVPEIVKSKS